MGMVALNINGRRYDVTCGDGEEPHLRQLGGAIDRRVRQLAASLGQVGEARLLLLTCLLLEDEVVEARAATHSPQDGELRPSLAGSASASTVAEENAGADIEALAERIEAVVGRLKPS